MIYCYTGTPGTGKSAHLARVLRFQLDRRNPRPVIANFPINEDIVRHPECFTYVPNHELNPALLTGLADEYWQTHDFKEEYLTLAIDECQ